MMPQPLSEGLKAPLSSDSRTATLTVVMPSLDEEKNLAAAVHEVLAAFETFGIDGELIIVNDGSRDKTGIIADELQLKDNRVRVIHHAQPMGVGASFWEGARQANKRHVTLIPGDNENPPAQVFAYLDLTRHVDLVIPFVTNLEVRSKSRRILSSLYRFIVNLSFGTNLNYTNGTVIYHAGVLKEITLQSNGFFFQTELLVRLIRAGYLFAEVPHFLQKRPGGTTKALSLGSLEAVVRSYLKLFWEVHFLRRIGHADTHLHPDSATMRRIRALSSKPNSFAP